VEEINMASYEDLAQVVPESVKIAFENYQFHKVMSQVTGIPKFSEEKIAEYMGGMMAARNQRWRPVFEGLKALQNLR
jgi:hypothetical protein